jgi:hypothetical protein
VKLAVIEVRHDEASSGLYSAPAVLVDRDPTGRVSLVVAVAAHHGNNLVISHTRVQPIERSIGDIAGQGGTWESAERHCQKSMRIITDLTDVSAVFREVPPSVPKLDRFTLRSKRY